MPLLWLLFFIFLVIIMIPLTKLYKFKSREQMFSFLIDKIRNKKRIDLSVTEHDMNGTTIHIWKHLVFKNDKPHILMIHLDKETCQIHNVVSMPLSIEEFAELIITFIVFYEQFFRH